MPLVRKLAAEFIGTFWLVLGGCGSAVLAAAFPHVGIGLLGVSLAFGLTVVTMAFAIGHVSGCHLNPAVTLGLVVGGRHPAKELLPYWVFQVLGAIAAAQVLVFIAAGNGSDPLAGGLAANGFGDHSPGNYSMALTLTLIHLISIPVTNTSVNPARSTGPAVFIQGWALSQLWLFWAAPLLGGTIGALIYRFVTPGWAQGPGDPGGPGT